MLGNSLRYPIIFAAVPLLASLGCQNNSTDPASSSLVLEGRVEVIGGGALTDVQVRLYAVPQDEQMLAARTDYPDVGFSPAAPSMFDPLSWPSLTSVSPNSDGAFAFSGLNAGEYMVDAALAGFVCPQPRHLALPDQNDAGTLQLVLPQPLNDIQQNAHWMAGSAYLLPGDVVIEPQATLTISGGVLILAEADAALIVAGQILALGDPDNPVRFRLTEEAQAEGDVWAGMRLEHPNAECQLRGISFQGASTALRVVSGQAQVSECYFGAPSAFAAYFSAAAQGSVAYSIIVEGGQGLVADNCSPAFERNLLLRTAGAGITAKSNSSSEVHHNVLLDCETGLWSDWDTSPFIHHNLISGGQYGLEAQNGFSAEVQFNEFRAQLLNCLYLHVGGCYPQLENNNFMDAPATIMFVNGNAGLQADTVSAPYNYWDGADASDIPDRIIDGHDIGSPENPIGPVDYVPFRTAPVPEAGP